MVVNENNPKIWASLIAPNPDDVTYWVDLTADPHGNIIKFYDENDEKWHNLTSPTSDYAVYPYIGPNGNWFIENKDSGISASGEIPNATINGYLLSTNPVLNKYDIGLGNVANLAPEEYPIPDGVYDLVAGKVDVTRKINGYSLSNDINLTKSDIGLSNVQNIAPSDMPISNAVSTALNGKIESTRNITAGYGLTGGGDLSTDRTLNVASANDGITVNPDNIQLNVIDTLVSTSVTQPLSANQGKILNDNKVPNTRTINSYPLSNNITLTKADVGLANVSNLAPADLPISTATQTALNGKVNTGRQVIAGTGLTGGGALTSDITLNISSGNDGIIASADAITLNTVNNLTSTSVTQPLSAAQGKVLQDSKINNNGTNSNIDVLHFNPTTLTALSNIGDVRYSDESKTLEVKVSDTVSIQLGQETQARVKNNAGVLISNGKVVYIDSASGANPLAKLATTADPDIAQRTFGMATEDIAINGFGAITTEGLVRNVNTSSFAEGAMLWLSTNGSVTTTEPVAPTPKVSIGMVLRSNTTSGVIYVKIRAIDRNSKLSDVYAPTLANGNILRWNSATSRFEVWDSITALANKVDVVAGKGLSTNDYTTTEKNKLAGISENANNYVHPATHSADILTNGTTNKVYTATEQTKLAGIATGAEVNVQSDWNAVSGDALILNKPTTINGYGITDAYTKTEVDTKLSSVYKYKGIVPTSADLPSTGMVLGDVWNVTDTNINYAWDGSAWDPLGGVVGADVSLATPTMDGLLSATDFIKLSGIEANANYYVHPTTHSADIIVDGTTNKVYTATEKTKLAGIAAGAEVNVNPDWNAVSGDAQILNKPTTISGYGITNVYTKTEVDTSLSGKEPTITAGLTSQYWRGDKSWQTLNKAAVGLSLVENTALSTWVGSTNISTVGNITNGTWSGATIGISKGGTNLTALGAANQLLRVNSSATALEYFTPIWPDVSFGEPTSQYSPLTINSVTRNLALDGHTHSYLPLSGGNLTGALTINGSTVWHAGDDGAGSGLDADTVDGLHSSNFFKVILNSSTSVNDYTFWENSAGKLYGSPDAPFGYYSFLSFGQGIYQSQFNGYSNTLKFRAGSESGLTDKAWRTVAFEDSNVASATKLANTRTIWGQPFNGENDITGNLKIGYANAFGISYSPSDTNLYNYFYGGSVFNLKVGEWTGSNVNVFNIETNNGGTAKRALSVMNNGFVGINTTGPAYELDVNGVTRSNYVFFKNYNDNGLAGYVGRGATNSNNLQLLSYSGNSVYIGANENDVSGITINTSNYVGIGTTSPQTKLDVNGTGRFTGNVTAGSLSLTSALSTTSGGTGLSTIGSAGQVLTVNAGATGLEWATSRDKGVNTVTTLTSLPISTRLVTATVTAATTISLASALSIGDEVHIIVYNNSASIITQTLPNTGSFISLSGTSISIPAGGRIEINILCYATTSYLIRAL